MNRPFAEQVASLPEQIRTPPAVEGEALPARGRLVIGGMGGSAIAGEFLAARLGGDRGCVQVRGRHLPGGLGAGDALLALSYSGDTSETLALWREAGERGMARAAVASGGALLAAARTEGDSHAEVPPGWAPRTAFGYLLRGAWSLAAAGAEPDWKALAQHLEASSRPWTAPEGPGARLAARLEHSLPVLLAAGTGPMAAARRWAAMLAENAKTASSLWEFPEAAHNLVMALAGPRAGRPELVLVSLGGADPDPRGWTSLLDVLGRHGGKVEVVDAPHADSWMRDLAVAYLGDGLSLLLAGRSGVDPASLSVMDDIKRSRTSA